MAEELTRGDKVEWNTPVKTKVRGKSRVGGTRLHGSREDPVYVVESDKSGKRAGHKRGALKKRS